MDSSLERAVRYVHDRDFFKAEQLFRQITRAPAPPEMAHFMYAHFKLLQGDYADAWPHFMHRLGDAYYRERPITGAARPLLANLDDPDHAGRVLLVHMDEGFGDAFMCARYLPLLVDRFKEVKFMVYGGLGPLFRSVHPEIEIIEGGLDVAAYDVHSHLFSLPALHGTTIETIPPATCLAADPAKARAWAGRIAGPKLRVGLAWQGKAKHPRDGERSLPFAALAPLLDVEGASFFSLQIGAQPGQADARVTDLAAELLADAGRFAETAAVIENLDLVITIDSALAHLTGALGRPVWVLLPTVPDWRWLLDRDDSPWYPTARLFRCQERYEWAAPVEAAAVALGELAGE